MLSDFLYAFNGVMPIFAVALVGYVLRQKNFLTDEFVKVADKLVFRVMLPCLLFTNVAYIDIKEITGNDFKLVLFCVASAIILTLVLSFVVPVFVKDKGKVGAFVQGVFRSNVAFLGLPFAQNLFGAEGMKITSIALAVIVPVYNVIAVIVLCVFNPKKSADDNTFAERIVVILKGIVKNPLIIAIVIALPFAIFGVGDDLPKAIQSSVDYFAKASTTLAVLTIGASFKLKELKGRIGLACVVALLKTVIVPALFMVFTYFVLGFRGVHLGVILIVFGTPTAISSYIMAKNMNSDASLANQIVLLTTLASMFTIFFFSFVMKTVGLVG